MKGLAGRLVAATVMAAVLSGCGLVPRAVPGTTAPKQVRHGTASVNPFSGLPGATTLQLGSDLTKLQAAAVAFYQAEPIWATGNGSKAAISKMSAGETGIRFGSNAFLSDAQALTAVQRGDLSSVLAAVRDMRAAERDITDRNVAAASRATTAASGGARFPFKRFVASLQPDVRRIVSDNARVTIAAFQADAAYQAWLHS